jgi:hypothetical protein
MRLTTRNGVYYAVGMFGGVLYRCSTRVRTTEPEGRAIHILKDIERRICKALRRADGPRPWLRTRVYFITTADEQFLKIGVSVDVESRLKNLQTSQPAKLRLVGIIEGDEEVEAKWHRRFRHLRTSGEWFRYADDLQAAIAREVLS